MSLRSFSKSVRKLPRTIEGLESRQLMAGDTMAAAPAVQLDSPAIADVQPLLTPGRKVDALPAFEISPSIDILPLLDPFVGVWTNPDAGTRGMTKIEITRDKLGNHNIRAFGACLPEDCNWGSVKLDLLGTSVIDKTPDYAIGEWDFDFKDTTITLANTPEGLVADMYHVYEDGSGRQDWQDRLLLTKSGKLLEVTDPGSDELKNVLLGAWVNSDANTDSITKLSVTQNRFTGQVNGQVWGACVPDDCDYGVDSMDLLGSSIGDETPEYGVLEYDAGFKTTYITTRFDNGDLVLGHYNVFNDGSGRSNYYSEERMWKLGDANHDGVFDSSDLVAVFQAGEYEDSVNNNSSWEDGDFNRDGDFNSADIIEAMQGGNYEAGAIREPLSIFGGLGDFFAIANKLKPAAIDSLFANVDLSEITVPAV
jgi:hypothetical protein